MKTYFWIIIIAVIALGYYLISSNSSSTGDTDSLTVNLTAQNDSGQSGQAVLTEEDGITRVVVTMAGDEYPDPQPAHIHLGACPTPGGVEYPLENLVNGTSTSIINTTIANLRASRPLAINIHKSISESSFYTACGNL